MLQDSHASSSRSTPFSLPQSDYSDTLLDEDFARLNAVSTNTAGRLELRDWLRQALARLNPRWAEMFVLRFVEDYSNREVARMMGTSPAVIAVLLHRTRAQLKRDYMTVTRGTR
ncbi:MAG: RNA polymerase sigma factor [Candidatus Angelobacter sp.]